MKLPHYSILFSILMVFCFSWSGYSQIEIPEKPSEQMAVYDGADLLKENEELQLRKKLESYADTTSTQIVVATIKSLNGEYIGTYATEWGDAWGIGDEDKDNGLLILISKTDAQIWFSTGYGLEPYLTDITTKTITEKIVLPEFRKGNYYEGIDKATTAVFEVLAGRFDASELKDNSKNQGTWPFAIFPILVFIVIFILVARKNKGGGPGGRNRRGGPDLLDFLILGSMGRSMGGGSFGGSSGGGFGGGGFSGGFGGGGFGGGGAGGSW